MVALGFLDHQRYVWYPGSRRHSEENPLDGQAMIAEAEELKTQVLTPCVAALRGGCLSVVLNSGIFCGLGEKCFCKYTQTIHVWCYHSTTHM